MLHGQIMRERQREIVSACWPLLTKYQELVWMFEAWLLTEEILDHSFVAKGRYVIETP